MGVTPIDGDDMTVDKPNAEGDDAPEGDLDLNDDEQAAISGGMTKSENIAHVAQRSGLTNDDKGKA